jgi:hypothetical protein
MTRLSKASVRLGFAGLALLSGLAGYFGPAIRAGEGEIDPKPRLSYEFDAIRRFGLAVTDDANKKHLLTMSPNGNTNSTVVRIDGKLYEFGTKEGKFLDPKSGLGDNKKGEKCVWAVGDIQVTQALEIVPSLQPVKGKRLLDTALITWTLKNTGEKPHGVGLRCVIDTLIEDNDGNPFVVAGKEKELMKTSADFKGPEVPKFVKAIQEENLEKPGYTAYFSFKVGGGIVPPDRVLLTNWPGLSKEWEAPVKNLMGDSSVVLYWNPAPPLEAGATRQIGFAYGGGEVARGGEGAEKKESKD